MKLARSIAVATAASFGGLVLAAGNSANEVGRVETAHGSVTMLLIEVNGRKVGGLYARDRSGIKSNLVTFDRTRLVELREVIDKTIAELDR